MATPDKPPKINDVFENEAAELVIRVSEYGKDLKTPVRFQAIVRHRNANKPWGVAVDVLPSRAAQGALNAFMALHGPGQQEDDLI